MEETAVPVPVPVVAQIQVVIQVLIPVQHPVLIHHGIPINLVFLVPVGVQKDPRSQIGNPRGHLRVQRRNRRKRPKNMQITLKLMTYLPLFDLEVINSTT